MVKTGIKVLDAMSAKPITVSPNCSLKDCAKIMLKKKVGSLIVREDHTMLGLITEKDVVRLVAKSLDPQKIKAKDLMVRRVKTISPDKDLYDAMVRMRKKKVRRLPVVAGKELVGMLTMNDILKIQPYLYDFISEKFRVLMKRKPNQEYMEGRCDVCDNYAQLYKVGGQLVCEECKDQVS